MTTDFPIKKHHFLLDGPSGKLEVAIDIPKTAPFRPITGIVCHPHPLYGGTMSNKVVTTLSWVFNQLGITTFRFNYRGVGQSKGSYGNFVGEQEDLACIMAFIKKHFPQNDLWLSGFSFGSYISARGAENNPQVKQLINIAPAVNHVDFYGLTHVNCPWLVVQGEKDEIVPADEVITWATAFQDRVTLKLLPQASHFFHGQLVSLRQCILMYANTL